MTVKATRLLTGLTLAFWVGSLAPGPLQGQPSDGPTVLVHCRVSKIDALNYQIDGMGEHSSGSRSIKVPADVPLCILKGKEQAFFKTFSDWAKSILDKGDTLAAQDIKRCTDATSQSTESRRVRHGNQSEMKTVTVYSRQVTLEY